MKRTAIFGTGAIGRSLAALPVLPRIFTPSGSTDFETIEIKGKTLDRAAVIITQKVIAPRYEAPSLSPPAGLAGPLPVGLGLDGLSGEDGKILGLGMAIERILKPLPPHALRAPQGLTARYAKGERP